jgi:hypothetical protein
MEILRDLGIVENRGQKIGINYQKMEDHNSLLAEEGIRVKALYQNIIEKIVSQKNIGKS